jgi:hypothetical protein
MRRWKDVPVDSRLVKVQYFRLAFPPSIMARSRLSCDRAHMAKEVAGGIPTAMVASILKWAGLVEVTRHQEGDNVLGEIEIDVSESFQDI